MPKVLKGGIYSLELGFPSRPPKGLREVCPQCCAELETEEKEKTSEPYIILDRKNNIRTPGWKVKCPECGKKVIFSPEKVPINVYQLLNPSPVAYVQNSGCRKNGSPLSSGSGIQ